MDKPRQIRTGEWIDEALQGRTTGCPQCVAPDPQVRSAHQLRLARDGIEALRTHLRQYYAQTKSADERQQYIDGVCGWVAGEMSVWSGYADPETGSTLPWWEARRKAHAMSKLALPVAVPERQPGEEV